MFGKKEHSILGASRHTISEKISENIQKFKAAAEEIKHKLVITSSSTLAPPGSATPSLISCSRHAIDMGPGSEKVLETLANDDRKLWWYYLFLHGKRHQTRMELGKFKIRSFPVVDVRDMISCFHIDEEKIVIGTRRHKLYMLLLSQIESMESSEMDVLFEFQGGHSVPIMSLGFPSSSYNFLVTGCQDGNLVLWNMFDGSIIQVIRAHQKGISGLLVTKDMEIVSVGFDKRICVFHATQCKVDRGKQGKTESIKKKILNKTRKLAHKASAQFKEKSQLLLSELKFKEKLNSFLVAQARARLREAPSEAVTYTLDQKLEFTGHSSDIYNLLLLDNETKIATASMDHLIKVWDLYTGDHLTTLTGHIDTVSSLCKNNTKSLLFSGSLDQTIKLWNWENGRMLCSLTRNSGWIKTIDCVSKFLITGGFSGKIEIWNWETQTFLYSINVDRGIINQLKVTSRWIIASCREEGHQNELLVIDFN